MFDCNPFFHGPGWENNMGVSFKPHGFGDDFLVRVCSILDEKELARRYEKAPV